MSGAAIVVPASNAWSLASSMEQGSAFPFFERFPQKFIVPFKDVKVDHRVFQLNQPLDLFLERVDEGWSCEEPILGLFGFGKNNVKAVCSVFQDFSVLWDEIAQAPNDVLSDDAQRIKLKLLSFVKSVTEV
jgi:hypothetical protein